MRAFCKDFRRCNLNPRRRLTFKRHDASGNTQRFGTYLFTYNAAGRASVGTRTRLPRPDWQDDPGRGGMRRSATPALVRLLKQACGRFSDGEQKARLLLA
jgi:hypothetical protein